MKRKMYLAVSMVLSMRVLAQTDTVLIKEMDEVVVTAQHQPQSVRSTVYQVRVINNERIRASGATSVQQVLTNQLGFRFSNDNTLGTTDMQLMGMSGRNVKILLDGVPMIDRGDTRESLGQIDINTVERIEIIEGPLSVVYGSDALAGVINIITQKPGSDHLSVMAKSQEETAGNEYYPGSYKGVHTQSLMVGYVKKHWSLSAGGNHNDFDGFGGDNYGRGKSWRPKEQWMGHARFGYSNDHITVYYRIDGLYEDITNRQPMNTNNYKAIDRYFITRRYTHQLQNLVRINSKLHWAVIVAYTDYSRRTETLRHDFESGQDETTGGQGEQDRSLFNSVFVRNTLNYLLNDKVSLQPGIEFNHENAGGDRIKGNPSIDDYAFFISAELKPFSTFQVRPGLRFIKNSVYDAPPVIPSVNAKWRLRSNLDLRLAYAYGFRSPALRELYFNFVDANHTIIGNPRLKAEYSNSYSASLTWLPMDKLSSTLGLYYNVFNDLIDYAGSPTSADTTITVNIDRYRTAGITWENKWVWKNLSASLGVACIGRYNELADDETWKSEDIPAFSWTPEINLNILYTLKKSRTTFGLFYKYTGNRPGYQVVYNSNSARDEVHLNKIGAFHWADITITQPVLQYFSVTAGIKNLFDVTDLSNTLSAGGSVHGTGGPVPMGWGRSYLLGLVFKWNNK